MMELLQDNTFWFAVSFVIFLAIAWPLGRKPVAAFFDNYIQKVRADLDEAARLRREAEALLADTKNRQHQNRLAAEEILKLAKEQVGFLQAQAVKDLEVGLKRREAQALERIQVLEEQAKAEIRAYAAQRALKAAEALLQSSFSATEDQALVERQIKQIGKV
ncbi:MAG: F0F1 ATP synthase subunit B [Proteobacteria bacterium]|nr:F0F1 ATP synthase subunit B [Pseudomonadota bacterium]